MENITICRPDELEQINDLLHDCWFDLENICVDNDIFKLVFTRYLETQKSLEVVKFLGRP